MSITVHIRYIEMCPIFVCKLFEGCVKKIFFGDSLYINKHFFGKKFFEKSIDFAELKW